MEGNQISKAKDELEPPSKITEEMNRGLRDEEGEIIQEEN